MTSDDKKIKSMDSFKNQLIVVTEKMDGENTTIYSSTAEVHARSLDSSSHVSQSFVRNVVANLCRGLRPNLRVCGENLFAEHSISYTSLESYFLVFAIFDDELDICLSWRETKELCGEIGLSVVPELWTGKYEDFNYKSLNLDFNTQEGFVMRVEKSFLYSQFNTHIAKFVRENHVQSGSGHWKSKQIVKNGLCTTY